MPKGSCARSRGGKGFLYNNTQRRILGKASCNLPVLTQSARVALYCLFSNSMTVGQSQARHYITFKNTGHKPKRADLEAIAKEVDGCEGGRTADWKSIMYWLWRPTFAADAPSQINATNAELPQACDSLAEESNPQDAPQNDLTRTCASSYTSHNRRRTPKDKNSRLALQSLKGGSSASGRMTSKTMKEVKCTYVNAALIRTDAVVLEYDL